MKILVTGGTGFAGKALVKRLLECGHAVVVLDYKEGINTDELRQAGAEIIIGSVTDRKIVNRCIQGIDVVQHLAAAFRELDVDDSYYEKVNIGGTKIVLEAAFKEKIKKFIYCSTCGVHGNIDTPPAGEDAPIQPADYYQRTKYAAEPIVNDYFKKGMKTVILRPAAIYGPGDPERFLMIFKRVSKGIFPMFGDGATYYHPLYVDNLIDAHLLSMEEGKGEGETYLIADKDFLTIKNLVLKVGKAMGIDVKIPHLPITPLVVAGYVCEKVCRPFNISPPIFPRRVDWFRQNRAFKIDKAMKDLNYYPKIDIDEGLKRTAKWYKSEGYL